MLRKFICTTFLAAVLAVFVSEPASAEGDALYALAVQLDWNETDHVADFPSNAHWSRLIAITHNSRYRLFRDGETASTGLALLATNGRTSVLEAELAEGRRRNRVAAHEVVAGIANGVGTFEATLDLKPEAPFVSLATMLAPSPDWFAGADSISLRDETGAWREVVTLPLWVWDAGADDGKTFNAPNAETQPRQSIRLLTHPAFLTASGMKPIGEVSLIRLD